MAGLPDNITERVLSGVHAGPDRLALRVGACELSYARLHEAALAIAGAVTDPAGVSPDRLGILAGSSPVTYTGVLAAFYAGAAAVPLSVNVPLQRTAGIVRSAGLTTLVVDEQGVRLASQLDGVRCVPADSVTGGIAGPVPAGQRPLREPRPVHAGDIAYIMFTSGSTGRPKGVPISHGNVTHFIDAAQSRYQVGARDVVAQTFEPTFDLFMFGLLMAWSANAALVAVPPLALPRLPHFVAKHSISLWFSVPSTIRLTARYNALRPGSLPTLTRSLFCGEALSCADAARWQAAAPGSSVDNLYGPTELTMACTAHRWRATDPEGVNGLVPIGLPFSGLRHVLVDTELCPVRDEGELCVSGPQTLQGYLDRRDDVDRFLSLDGHRWYRTGDRVRRLADGSLTYLGRLDHQVQVRGYRVELPEIEHAMRQTDGVSDAAVVFVEHAGEPAIVAFYSGDAAATERISVGLAAILPRYMLPDSVQHLEALPLNVNGKVDRIALAAKAG